MIYNMDNKQEMQNVRLLIMTVLAHGMMSNGVAKTSTENIRKSAPYLREAADELIKESQKNWRGVCIELLHA